MSEMGDSGSAVESAESTAEATDAEAGQGEPAVPPASDGYYIGGPELEAEIAKMQEQQAGTEVANSGGSGEAGGGATDAEAGQGEPAVPPASDGYYIGGPELEAEIAKMQEQQAGTEVANSGGSGEAGGGATDAEAGQGEPAVPPASDGYYIGGPELEKDITIQKMQNGLKTHLNDPNTRDQFPGGYDPFHGGTPEQYLDRYASSVNVYGKPSWNWPKPDNHGAVEGSESPRQLQPGVVLDRYGSDQGRYMCLSGTSYPERSLPADRLAEKYHQYKVVRPFTANVGQTAAAFGEPGGGIQFRTDQTIRQLVNDGYLEEISL